MKVAALPDIATPREEALSPHDRDPRDDSAPASTHAELHDDLPLAQSTTDVHTDVERPTILVVEDHAELRGYLRRHLEERYHVIEAVNGLRVPDRSRAP